MIHLEEIMLSMVVIPQEEVDKVVGAVEVSIVIPDSIILICNLLMKYLDNSLEGKTHLLTFLMKMMISLDKMDLDKEVWVDKE